MKLVRLLLLVIVPLFPFFAAAQEVTLRGRIVSSADRQPVPFASVVVAGKSRGTSGNAAGEFSLLVAKTGLPADSLGISALGYRDQKVAVTDFPPDRALLIVLQKLPVQLREVRMSAVNGLGIVNRAIAAIPKNYIVHPYTFRGFYRNTTRNGDNFLELSEAAFDIYHFATESKQASRMKLLKARDVKNERDFGDIEVGQKPGGIFDADVVRNLATHDVFGKESLGKYNFVVLDTLPYQGRRVFEIGFSKKSGVNQPLYRGKVLIDTESYAFLLFDYGYDPAEATRVPVIKGAMALLIKMLGIKLTRLSDERRVTYRPLGDRWVLSDVVDRSRIMFKSDRMKMDFAADIGLNYLVTDVDTTAQTPLVGELSRKSTIEDHDTDPRDDFWKNYTTLVPDFDMEAAIAKINAINAELNLRSAFEQRLRKLPKDPQLRIDSMLQFYHSKGQFNGMALVKQNGGVLLQKAYGYADQEKRLAANEHTAFRVGSLAKSFTAVVVAQLVQEGKMAFDAPVGRYLPGYAHGEVTIGQLLSHRAGIPNYTDNNEYLPQIIREPFSLAEIVTRFCSDPLEFSPGSSFHYSNSNFAVAALAAEKAAGIPFASLLRDRILTPLNMNDSFSAGTPGQHPNVALGYSGKEQELSYQAANTTGAGGLYSSAGDLLRFNDALESGKLLRADLLDSLLRPHAEFKDYKASYGYGWMIDKGLFSASEKHLVTYHPGTDLGFFTLFVRQPDRDNCVILLNNTGAFPRFDLADLILRELNR